LAEPIRMPKFEPVGMPMFVLIARFSFTDSGQPVRSA